jgi:hypothetical protein
LATALEQNKFFFLVVDDGGFQHLWPNKQGETVDFSAYENLLRLANAFDIQIGLACTTRFLDVHRISNRPAPHADSLRVINLLERNSDRLLVADHGYDHQFGSRYCEFHDYHTGRKRPLSEQEEHLEQSIKIYQSLGWPVPHMFVPPAHGWEPGITDQLYANHGFHFLSSVLWIKNSLPKPHNFIRPKREQIFSPLISYPDHSNYLKILPRLGLGIPSQATDIDPLRWYRAYHSVLPTNTAHAYLWHRRQTTQPHNYMAHIGNFAFEENYRAWHRLLERISETKAYLATSFNESIILWDRCRQ